MISYHGSINGISRFLGGFFFAMLLAESQFPNQGLNPGHISEKPKTLTTRQPGNSPAFMLFSSVQFSRSVMSDSLRPHELQCARPPCPSSTPGVHSNSCPLSRWCHPAISSSVVPSSSCPQSLPASESFPVSQLFAWGSQSTGVSALVSFLPKKSQGWSPSEYKTTG